MDKIVVDTSIIIDGEITKLIESGNLKDCEIIIPVAVLDELQSQASQSKDYGFVGLEEIKKIRELAQKSGITLRFEGQRPSIEDIKLARHGRIDAIIKDIAKKNDAMFYTADYVQALVAQAEGIKTKYSKPEIKVTDLEFEKFFDNQTMSVHLKEGTPPVAKRGKPGAFLLVQLDGKILTKEYLEGITTQILEVSRVTRSGVVEISKPGALVVQFRDFRVVITHPPFSDSFENAADILLLVIPDYTIYDEIRRFHDFRVFSDLRLAGVGMVGVVHANAPLDAIQRFIGKVDLGMIPHILDTVVFVEGGEISKVYELEFKVKVPTGMTEQDLARPVIEVRNFENHSLEYEIYTYGEENIVIPI